MSSYNLIIEPESRESVRQCPMWFYQYREKQGGRNEGPETLWSTNFPGIPTKDIDANAISDWQIPGNCFLAIAETRNMLTHDVSERNDKGEVIVTKKECVLPIHPASVANIEDLKLVLRFDAHKYIIGDHRFCFKEILWLLNGQDLDIDTFQMGLGSIPKNYVNPILDELCSFGKCLSYPRQEKIKSLLSVCGKSYEIFLPEFITGPIGRISSEINLTTLDENLFRVIDFILSPNDVSLLPERTVEGIFDGTVMRNALSCPSVDSTDLDVIAYWLVHSEYKLHDYSLLNQYFPFLSPSSQKKSIDRYFYDVYKKRTALDVPLLEDLNNNRSGIWENYRFCINEPYQPINLTSHLYLDSILTIKKTEGKEIATFNGVLDNVFSRLEYIDPNAYLGLKEIIPTCNGGYRINKFSDKKFHGFVKYKLYYGLIDLDRMKESNRNWCKSILDSFCVRNMINVCPLDRRTVIGERCSKYECSQKPAKAWNGTWSISGTYTVRTNILSLFLKDELITPGKIITGKDIDVDRLSSKILQYLRNNFPIHDNPVNSLSFDLSDNNDKDTDLVARQFLRPNVIKCIIRSNILLGKDLFHLADDTKRQYLAANNKQSYGKADVGPLNSLYREAENKEIIKRVRHSLSEICNIDIEENSLEKEVSYDDRIISKLRNQFYAEEYFKDDTETNETLNPDHCERYIFHLTKFRFERYCAPELSDRHDVIDLPYYSCRVSICYYSNLEDETVSKLEERYNEIWHHFDLLIISEIMGYPLVKMTGEGVNAGQKLRSFIGIINKIRYFIEHLKCHECGHLLFARDNAYFNKYNHFTCRNKTCKKYGNDVYLNYCYKCNGFIDSREVKRCPNGLYICPRCLSCCDDDLFERKAEDYIRRGQEVPMGIRFELGHGHNDKGMYFCPHCGQQMKIEVDENSGTKKIICRKCGLIWEKNQK